MLVKISVVIPVKNEESRLGRCLDVLKGWADEIIIIDDHSTDRTASIAAREYRARVVTRSLANDWAQQRNAGADAARNDWVLQLDADEVVAPETAAALQGVLGKGSEARAYALTRVNVLLGKPLVHCGADKRCVRLYDRRHAAWEGHVHEQLRVSGTVGTIAAPIYHYPADSVEHFLEKNLSYAKISAEQLLARQTEVPWKDVRCGLTSKALKLFWKGYVKRRGYKDGMQGLVWCVLSVITLQMYWLMVWQKAAQGGKLKT